MLRSVLLIPESDLLKINEEGQLEGQMKSIFEETVFYLILKFNVTWIPVSGHAETGGDVTIEAIKMIEQDKVDLVRVALHLLDGLPTNVSIGVVNHNGWCKIASSPSVTSLVLTGGPESALKNMSIGFLTLVLIGLLLMIYLANRKFTDRRKKYSPMWTLYTTLVRNYSAIKMFSIEVQFVSLAASFLIQILFSSLLHTERASISSFTRIDSFEDVRSHGSRKFVLDFSVCARMLQEKQEFEIIPFADAYLSGESYQWCASSSKCILLVSHSGAYFLRSFMCSLDPKMC